MKKRGLESHMHIHFLLLFLGAAVEFVAVSADDSLKNPWTWIGFGLILFAVWYRSHYVRCPHCGSKMKYIRTIPNNCPDCGEKLI